MINTELKEIKDAYSILKHVSSLPPPPNLEVSQWWKNLQQSALEFGRKKTTFSEIVCYAQLPTSGFDHRRERDFVTTRGRSILSIIEERYWLIAKEFPKVNLDLLPEESDFSRIESIASVEGKQYSNVFLYHLYIYLTVSEWLEKNSIKNQYMPKKSKVLLEVGGGYGGLARIFLEATNDTKYILTDLPEMLFFSYSFIRANFPEKSVKITSSHEEIDLKEWDVNLVPIQFSESLLGHKFDAVINTGSLQEMPDKAISYWMNLIKNVVGDGFFYSFNYFLNDNRLHTYGPKGIMNKGCLRLEKEWNIKKFAINPKVLCEDVELRNWLELVVELRIDDHDDPNSKTLSHEKSFKDQDSIGSDKWFEYHWRRHFSDPLDIEPIRILLLGIDKFKRGECNKNNLPINKKASLLKGCKFTNISPQKSYFPAYGEEYYLRSILEKQGLLSMR
ncbi:putative sugar O-methyltransferase [Prochlorococcus sp. MIT 1306]|uniref:putative sugar O-methyltransferase n=1 Tax=Prochlorococcus sp. MIT 1306 TaxID=1799667 RepID=UPI0007B3B222|nr:putative sugar O-methyltransferase [Prochlorococcus sp. MIT 1306]KZR65057.1 hypothetical protein PMIT1306_00739 [Prochlorococcus sp. MIT 1306]